jgi:hypothetical protein
MNTKAITIDVYDVYGKKIIKGIVPVNSINQKLSIVKTKEIHEN